MLMIAVLALCGVAVTAIPTNPQKIVGGTVTTIESYPNMVAMLVSWDGNIFSQNCGGTILNTRSILTAAHCTFGMPTNRWRARVGSTWANSGGVVHILSLIINHPNYIGDITDADISIVRTVATISYNNAVRPASIAGANYNLADNQVVWATGWGLTSTHGQPSEQLRHVQLWTVNQDICRTRYASVRRPITDNMLCSGWLNVGGRDQCFGDSGGPLYHNGVVVGVCSFGNECGRPDFPGVNARVTRFSTWIQANA